jgi:hypothetical protein
MKANKAGSPMHDFTADAFLFSAMRGASPSALLRAGHWPAADLEGALITVTEGPAPAGLLRCAVRLNALTRHLLQEEQAETPEATHRPRAERAARQQRAFETVMTAVMKDDFAEIARAAGARALS